MLWKKLALSFTFTVLVLSNTSSLSSSLKGSFISLTTLVLPFFFFELILLKELPSREVMLAYKDSDSGAGVSWLRMYSYSTGSGTLAYSWISCGWAMFAYSLKTWNECVNSMAQKNRNLSAVTRPFYLERFHLKIVNRFWKNCLWLYVVPKEASYLTSILT